MFDLLSFDRLLDAARAAAAQPVALATVEQKADALRALAAVRDVLDGAMAAGLADLDATGGHLEQGAPTVAAWARQHLRLDARAARTLVKAGRTLGQLPEVAEASRAGSIRLEHVNELTGAITRLGVDTVRDAQHWLVPVAQACDPAELRATINELDLVTNPDRLDDAYAKGMDRRDLQVNRCGEGFHVTGFLDVLTGAKLTTWLSAAAAPTTAEDDRAPSERRVAALDELLSSVLDAGMPADRGVRPHLHVTVDADTMAGHPAGAPADLAGFGPIGPALLAQLTCTGAITPVVVDGTTTGPTPQANVLDVGRTHRLATPAQRVAVLTRQHGTCATPGCHHTHLEIHHVAWWDRDGGRTDLANLIGLCSRCHHQIHAHQLTVEPDQLGGFTFTTTGGTRLEDHHRRTRHAVRHRLRALRQAVADQAPRRTSAPSRAPRPSVLIPGPQRGVRMRT